MTITPWIDAARPARAPAHLRAARGIAAHARGHAAEGLVAARYAGRGCEILERCWRSPAGEVDLILREGDTIVFVEVKTSDTHDLAARRISRRQMDRICQAALLYAGQLPDGAWTELRFDAALVDAGGRVEIVENAFGLD